MTDILLIFSQLKNIPDIPYLLSQLDHETRSCINSFQGETFHSNVWPSKLRPSELGGGPLCHEANCPLKWPT